MQNAPAVRAAEDSFQIMGKQTEDLSGKHFGRLVVVRLAGYTDNKGKRKGADWLCECDCGNFKIVHANDLKRGNTKSCGCLWKERVQRAGQKTWKIYLKPYIDQKRGDAVFAGTNAIFRLYKDSARKKGIDFSLTKDCFAILINAPCFYCGRTQTKTYFYTKRKISIPYNGIDRIDPQRGYTEDNVRTCCWDCNRAKGTLNEQAFINHIFQICKHLKGVKNVK